MPAPVLLAPIGVMEIVHPEAERAVARAARATGIPMVLSTAASNTLEVVAEDLGRLARAGSSSTTRATATWRRSWSAAPRPPATPRSC